jgi:HK97 family phage portal protein
MGLFGFLTQKEAAQMVAAAVKAAMLENAPNWLRQTADAERYSIPDPGVYGNQADLFRKLSWILQAVEITAHAAAVTRFDVKRVINDQEPKDIPNHPFEMLLRRPNPLDSRFEFLAWTVTMFKLTGNCYWWMNRPDEFTPPDELWGIPSSKITPVLNGNMIPAGYMYYPGNGSEIMLPPHEITHFKRTNPNSRFVGLSAIEAIAMVAQGDLGMQKYNTVLFEKNNGRLPSVMAFEQMIADPTWDKIKEDTREASRNREMLMLRGVGQAGGLQWLQNSVSQREMEFLAGRQANKEEIYNTLAPGLFSMLSENATEANSRTGRAAFNELTLYPMHVMMGEKISNEILPTYGTEKARPLVGEFEDVRMADKQMELNEIVEYSKTHTIAEIREKWYGDDKLGDERDDLLPAQIEATSGGIQEPPMPAPTGIPGENPRRDASNPPKEKALKADENSTMIALRIPDVIRQEIKKRYSFVDAETLSNLHITLVYLGDSRTIDKPAVLRAVNNLGMYQSPIKGSLQGLARFVNGGEKDPLVLTFDSPQMPALYEVLCLMLDEQHVPYHREHGFIPHMTLAYIPSSAKIPVNTIEPLEINFSEVYLVDGEAWLPVTLNGRENKAIKSQYNEALEEIRQWERKTARIGAKAAAENTQAGFMVIHLPGEVESDIRKALPECKTETAVKMVFERARVRIKPKPAVEVITPPPAYDNNAGLFALAKSLDGMISAYKSQTTTTPPNIYLPAQTFNMPQTEHVTQIHMPNQPAPQTTVHVTPTVEAAKAPDVHVSSPVNIHQTVEPASPPNIDAPITINQTIEPAAVPAVEIPAPVTNVNIENKMPDQPAPVANVTVENKVEPTPVKFSPTIETPAPVVHVTNEVKTPRIRSKKTKVERDAGNNIEGTTEKFEYEDDK